MSPGPPFPSVCSGLGSVPAWSPEPTDVPFCGPGKYPGQRAHPSEATMGSARWWLWGIAGTTRVFEPCPCQGGLCCPRGSSKGDCRGSHPPAAPQSCCRAGRECSGRAPRWVERGWEGPALTCCSLRDLRRSLCCHQHLPHHGGVTALGTFCHPGLGRFRSGSCVTLAVSTWLTVGMSQWRADLDPSHPCDRHLPCHYMALGQGPLAKEKSWNSQRGQDRGQLLNLSLVETPGQPSPGWALEVAQWCFGTPSGGHPPKPLWELPLWSPTLSTRGLLIPPEHRDAQKDTTSPPTLGRGQNMH